MLSVSEKKYPPMAKVGFLQEQLIKIGSVKNFLEGSLLSVQKFACEKNPITVGQREVIFRYRSRCQDLTTEHGMKKMRINNRQLDP